jgi:predicted nucleic acid-binding protein
VKNNYVLDTSAVITYLENENGAAVIEELLEKAEAGQITIFLSFVTFTEIYYITIQKKGKVLASERIESMETLPVKRIESNVNVGQIAGEFKAACQLSFADAWISALAKYKNAILVHKDPEFEALEKHIQMLKLPYKTPSQL